MSIGRRLLTGRRTSVALLLALVLAFGGCARGEPDDGESESALSSDRVSEKASYSMALGSIEAVASENSRDSYVVAVVVPSDTALLALDADRLAELAADGGLESLIIELEASDDVDLGSPSAIQGSEEFVFSSAGSAHLLSAIAPAPTFAGQPIRVIERWSDLTVIVVDGIVEP